MGLAQFAFASAIFFITPSSVLLILSNKARFLMGLFLMNVILFLFAYDLFPLLSRDVLGVNSLMFRFYCYLVLTVGTLTGGVLKAIELNYYWGIIWVFNAIALVNVLAYFSLCSI